MLYQRGTTTIRDFIAPPAIKLSPNTMQIGGVLSRTYFAVAYPRFLSTIRSAHFLFEVLDPETQAPAPEGQAGELVITTLTKQALPMLRYRTRDITRITTAPCDCCRTHLRILRIAGRSDDMLIIRGVNVYPSQIEAVLVGRPMLAPHYLLVVERHGPLDHVTIEVEALPGLAPEAFAAIAHDVAHHVKSMVGVTTRVVVKLPGEIPRSQGKAVRVRDLRPEE